MRRLIPFKRWVTLSLAMYSCPDNDKYCQKLKRRVHMASSCIHNTLPCLVKSDIVELYKKEGNKRGNIIDLQSMENT